MSKYPRTKHFQYSLGATNDDRISDDVSNFINQEIIISEKLDGSNGSFVKNGVYGRSHADFSRNPWDREMWNIYQRIKNDIPEDTFIFGENMEGIHSISYSNLSSYFYMFGVRENNIWVSWDSVEEWSEFLNLPLVPVLFRGIVKSEKELQILVEKLCKEKSFLGGEREGIVARNANMFHNDDFSDNVIKWVRSGHVTTDKHWQKNWVKAKLKNYA